jgi:predicted NBD/HSP70 family sugar kinase
MNLQTEQRASLLRSASDAASRVFTTILTRGPISRIEVARRTGLSQAAVTKAVTPLVEAGLVDTRLDTARDGRPGRPVSPVAIIPDAMTMLGIKVNVDEIIAVATDLTTQTIARERRELVDHGFAAVVAEIVAACQSLAESLGNRASTIAGVGVAVSGDVDLSTGMVRESALMGWTEADLGTELGARLAWPTIVENDVRALTIGEQWFGVGLGTTSFAIVTIGRGIGSGLYVNGQVVEGAYGVAGEIGHLPLAPPDRICPCGRRGCVEAVAGAAGIVEAVSRELGRDVDLDEVVRLAHDGVPAASRAFREAASLIGTAIASLVNLAGPELVIIGGEGVSDFDLFDETLRDAFHAHAFGAAGRCRIVVRPHTFEDWARGAAAAAVQALVR